MPSKVLSKDELLERFKKVIEAMGLDIAMVNEEGIFLEWIKERRKTKKFKS